VKKSTVQWIKQPNNRHMMLKRDEMLVAVRDTEVRPCISRQATPEERAQYGIRSE